MTQTITLRLGNSFDVIPELEGVDAVVCDPPYGLEFMGKEWDNLSKLRGSTSRPDTSETAVSMSTRGMDHGIHAGKPAFDLSLEAQTAMTEWHKEWLQKCFDLLPSGGVIKVFSATRTFHRLAQAMEQVGFVDLDLEAWIYGSGFPKSLNLSKAIDRHLGKSDERVVLGPYKSPGAVLSAYKNWQADSLSEGSQQRHVPEVSIGSTPEAQRFEGWGTALKPAWEPFLVGVKP